MNQHTFHNLSTITNRINALLQPAIGKTFWVKAEISSGRERGGTFYCDLVETNKNGKIIAKMSCTIWNRELYSIRAKFSENKLDLKLDNGTSVGFLCSVQYNLQYGLSLKVTDADPAFALGVRISPLSGQETGSFKVHSVPALNDFIVSTYLSKKRSSESLYK